MRLTWMSRMAAVRVAAAVSVPEEPKGCCVRSSRAAPMETSFDGRGREVHADVGPAGVAVDALRKGFDVEGGFGERVGEFLARGVEVLRILEDGGDGVGGFERDGELVAEAGDIGGGEKWSERRDHRDRGEAEVGLAVLGVFEALDDARGGATERQRMPSSAATTRLALMDFVPARISARTSACVSGRWR